MIKQAILSLVVLTLAAAPSAFAQKQTEDPRPLQGLNRDAIPTYSSLDAYLQANPSVPGRLQAAATPVGTLKRMPLTHGGLTSLDSATPAKRAGDKQTLRLERAPNGTVRWLGGALKQEARRAPAGVNREVFYTEAASSVLDTYAGVLRLDRPSEELRALRTEVDPLGYAHARFEQTYDGVPVWGRDLYVHFDDEGAVYALNGTYEPTPRGADTTPELDGAAAEARVVADLKDRQRWAPLDAATARALDMDGVETRLVLYPSEADGMRLAYEVSLHPNFLEYYTYIVDAHDGRVLNRIERHCSVLHTDNPPPAEPVHLNLPAVSSAAPLAGSFVNASGVDLNNVTQNLRVFQADDGTFLQLWDLSNLAPGFNATPQQPFPDIGGSVVLTANNVDLDQNAQLFVVTSNNNTWADAATVSAHAGAKTVYDYFNTTFGRKAIDDNDQSVISVTHVTQEGQPMDNAFWNGRVMAYGDGNQAFSSLAGALDVAAHEMTHGVVQHTANLVYQFQSGALNESFADVFGVMLDRQDFLLGEDIALPNFGPALRDMLNPGNPQLSQPQPASMLEYADLTIEQDNGGVHVNSGIPNRAAALIIQSIGHDKTQQIYYRALSMYMTRNSQFGDARNAVEQAATDLHGANSPEVTAVRQGFDAVGITNGSDGGNDGGNDLPPQTGGVSYIAFLTQDGEIGTVNMSDSNFPTNLFAEAVARVDNENNDRTQVSTTRDGGTIWYIGEDGFLYYIVVQTGELFYFPELNVQEPGDLWNVSISPDGNEAALVSAYDNDPTIYITDGQSISAIALEAESTQEGIENQTIRYPDVLSWSPNPTVPRIAFDALNSLTLSGNNQDFWSIYEIDFTTERVYGLLPPQEAGLSVGNITYSSTNPDIIAFNTFDQNGTWDIVEGNFETGQLTSFDVSAAIGVTDGQRPTYAPDDSEICFSNPSEARLLFYDGQQYTQLTFEQAVYNPNWFVTGAAGGTENQAPQASFTVSSTSGSSPLRVTFDASASSDPEGGDMTYRWTFGNGASSSGVTASHAFVAVKTYTVTLTAVDAGGKSGTATAQITVTDGPVAVEDGTELPKTVALQPNYPNPFNPSTVLGFDLPVASDVRLAVYDLLGRAVETVADGAWPAGAHEVRFDAGTLPSGTYVVRLEAGGVVQTRKIVLLR